MITEFKASLDYKVNFGLNSETLSQKTTKKEKALPVGR